MRNSTISLSLQDSFLNQAKLASVIVSVHLTNGLKLQGKVKGYDNFTLIIHNNGREHLIYKHAVSTIIPFKPAAVTGSCDNNKYNNHNNNRDDRANIGSPEKKDLEALVEKYKRK